MALMRWRTFGITLIAAAGLAVLIGAVETAWIAGMGKPNAGDLVYGTNLHLLIALLTVGSLRIVLWKLRAERFIPIALAAYLAAEGALTGTYWILRALYDPPLSLNAGRVIPVALALGLAVVGGLLGGVIGRLAPVEVRRRRPTTVWGPAGITLAVALIAANALAVSLALPRTPRIDVGDEARLEERPHILVVLVDTLRRDHLSGFGYDRPTSPNLDALYAESWRFANAYTPSAWTIPSVASIFTGLHPGAHRIREAFDRIPDYAPTLAEHLRSYGYQTGAFVANKLVTTTNGFNQGFGRFFPPGAPWWCRNQRTALEQLVTRAIRTGNTARGWRINQEALRWIRGKSDRPCFAYIHYMEPHAPYAAPEKDREAVAPGAPAGPLTPPNFLDYSARIAEPGCWDWECLPETPTLPPDQLEGMVANYDASIHLVDRRIGDLMRELDEMGVADRAHVIFCSDHGEQFLDHSGWGHGKSIYEELTGCPLAYRPPGGLPSGGGVVERPVSLLDMLRTVCLLAGLEAPPLHQGEEIPELLAAGTRGADRPILSEIVPRLYSMRYRNWKLIRRGSPDSPEWRLFDRRTDPGEQVDLAAVLPDTLAYLQGYFAGLQAKYEQTSLREVESRVDPEMLRQLRDLGYIK